jgi:hypothetical protein
VLAQGQRPRRAKTAYITTSASPVTVPLSNPSLERTSTGWPRYARCSFSASRGQPVASAQVKR